MEFLHLNATYGRLEQQELHLRPGLNVICAPNEAGKSTWSSFIRTMLYGLPSRDRGPLADKNRYAPWSGAAMQGRMDVLADGRACTLLRSTRRAVAPMGDFSCTYTGTATHVEGITALNAGEQLLGVPRDVFERSAFIGQNALAVEQSAELERRIAALITTGEEDASFTESYDRLKKQLNRRRSNRTTGQIPALEREIDQLHLSLQELDALERQARQAQEEVSALERRTADLRREAAQQQARQRQERVDAYRAAAQAAEDAQCRADTLAQDAAAPPTKPLRRGRHTPSTPTTPRRWSAAPPPSCRKKPPPCSCRFSPARWWSSPRCWRFSSAAAGCSPSACASPWRAWA